MDKKIKHTTNAVIQTRLLTKLCRIKNKYKDKIAMVSPSDTEYFKFDILALSLTPEMYSELHEVTNFPLGHSLPIIVEIDLISGRKIFRIRIAPVIKEKAGLGPLRIDAGPDQFVNEMLNSLLHDTIPEVTK